MVSLRYGRDDNKKDLCEPASQAILNTLEVFEGLLTIVTVVLCLAGGGAKFALQLRVQRVAIGAGDDLGAFQALEEIFVFGSFAGRGDAVLFELLFGFIGHPVGRPGFGKVLPDLEVFHSLFSQLELYLLLDGRHGRASGIGGGNFYDDLLFLYINFSCNAYLHNIEHGDLRVGDFAEPTPDLFFAIFNCSGQNYKL